MSESPQRAGLLANSPLSSARAAGLRADLRGFARQHLPAAAVPTRFVLVPALPKLANGKVDRKQLAAIPTESASSRSYAPPATPEEIRMAAIWADILNVERVGLDDDFFELGGNSLNAAQIAARVREETGQPLNLRRFFEQPTVAGLLQIMSRPGASTGPTSAGPARSLAADELAGEAVLPADVAPPAGARPCEPPYSTIFLTGGTGYTGAYLVRELLDRSAAHLHVLVRGRNPEHARRRLRQTLETYGLWRADDGARLTALVGDLAQPYLGLDRRDYETLRDRAELIVHNGALSSYALPYRMLKPVNVLGTLEVLRLACRGRLKPVHYVSSLGVYPGVPGTPRWAEDEVRETRGVLGGYRQTKWVGDSMMFEAGRRGLPFCVYRPGLITGSQATGACSTDTFINASIKGCIQLGATFPFDATLEATPVDFCAAAIAHVALSGRCHGQAFNMPGGRTMAPTELFDRVQAYGYRVDRVDYRTWRERLVAALDRGEDNELARFLPLFGDERPSDEMGYQGGSPEFDTAALDAALAGSEIRCAEPDAALWTRYLDWFVQAGFLPPPPMDTTESQP